MQELAQIAVRQLNTTFRISSWFFKDATIAGDTIPGSQHVRVVISTSPTPLVALSTIMFRYGNWFAVWLTMRRACFLASLYMTLYVRGTSTIMRLMYKWKICAAIEKLLTISKPAERDIIHEIVTSEIVFFFSHPGYIFVRKIYGREAIEIHSQ